MRYILKYQRYPVMELDLTFTPHGINFNRVMKIIDRPLLPFALQNVPYPDMLPAFKRWYLHRLMPSDRAGIEIPIKNMSMTNAGNEIDWKGAIILMSVLAYGRNMTDKYWLTPAKDLTLNTGHQNHGLNGSSLRAKVTYKGLDFHKNGIAEDYRYAILHVSDAPKTSMDFNCPDFCTNGKEKKCFIRERDGSFWLEKYVSCGMGEFKEKARMMTLAYNECPEIFPLFQFIMSDDAIPIGYKTRCFTAKDTELVTLRDVVLNANGKSKDFSKDKIVEALSRFIEEDAAKEYVGSVLRFLPERKLADNAGLIINSTSKTIQQKIAWL